MPLYVVRWPSFNVSLLKARNEKELLNLLDEEGDPAACRYAIYDGPVWINFDLPLKASWRPDTLPATTEMRVEGFGRSGSDDALEYRVSLGGSDAAFAMRDALTSFAFPHIQRTFEAAGEDGPDSEDLKVAIQKELQELARYLWRVAHVKRATDPKSALLVALGLTKAPPWLEDIWSQPPV